jgi:hypothetical protein
MYSDDIARDKINSFTLGDKITDYYDSKEDFKKNTKSRNKSRMPIFPPKQYS